MFIVTEYAALIYLDFSTYSVKPSLLGQLCILDPHFVVKRLFLHRLSNQYLFHQLRTGVIVDVFRILDEMIWAMFCLNISLQVPFSQDIPGKNN